MLFAASILWTRRWHGLSTAERSFTICLLLATITETSGMTLKHLDVPNSMVYKTYMPLEFALLLHVAWSYGGQRLLRWSLACLAGVFVVLLLVDWTRPAAYGDLIPLSMLYSTGMIAIIYAALLIHHAESSPVLIWRTHTFWMLLSVLLFMGPALPFLGILDELYASDPGMAQILFQIIEVLFLLRYGAVLIAAWFLYRSSSQPLQPAA